MPDDPRVQELLDKLLDEDVTPEAVCRDEPELLPIVLGRWRQICRARAKLDELFPTCPQGIIPPPPTAELPLPKVPGYSVEAVLGRGGMGIVFRARQLGLKRLVAIKMGLADAYVVPQERERFRREAEAVAALRHPNIVQVHDVGDADGRPYFTMEYLEGGSLAQKLAETPQPAREAAELLAALADAMHAAHQGGIVHRDLKPANIIFTSDGIPKITDFGLAQRLEGGVGLTLSGTMLGTPCYMAPEQARGQSRSVGPAADVYSLGAVLYEMLTGRPPFRAESSGETVHRLLTQDPVPPSRLNSKTPRSLETVCLKCLNKDPQRRYASAAELSADLQRFLRQEPILAKPIGPMGRLSHWVLRHRGLAAALSAVAVLLLMLAAGSLVAMFHFRELSIRAEQLREQSEARGSALRCSLYSAEMNLCRQAANSPGGISRVHDWLLRWKDSKPDLRGWEWFYLYGLCRRDIDTLSVSAAGLWCIAVSPDGEKIAVAGNDPVIYLFDAKTRKPIQRFIGHDTPISAVTWSPNGLRLASASWDGALKIWDAKTAQELRTLPKQDKPIFSAAWNRDGQLLAAAGESGPIEIWDASTGELVRQLDGHAAGVRGLAWNPNDNRVASAGMDAAVRIWDLNDPTNSKTLNDHGNWVNAVAWSPDGIRLASVSNDRTCKIWNTQGAAGPSTLAGHSEGVLNVSWSSDGSKLATCGEDQTIRIWNANDGKELAALRGHTRKVTSIAWCNGIEQLVSSSHDGTVKFWSAVTRGETPQLHVNGAVTDLAWSPDGLRIAESSGAGPVTLLDPNDLEPPIVLGSERSSLSVSWAPNGKLLASGGYNRTVHIWNVDTGAEAGALSDVGPIHSVAWSHRIGALAAIHDGACISVWKVDGGALLRTLGGQQSFCFAIAWSPNDRYIASAWNDGAVRVFEVESGIQAWNVTLHDESTLAVAWSRDGKSIASAGGDGLIQICDAVTGAKRQTLQGHTGSVVKLAWRPNGDRLASASSDGSVRVWDPVTGKLMLSLIDHSAQMKAVAWSPDGKTLAAGSEDGAVMIFDAVPGYQAAEKLGSPR